ncbi:LacI family DNA-binding transcriptional regulator [Galbitalea sp. SE-J8]|uniref:LacI family DNA-binding transcriptional regulator n=1 Tax=Galbitalea sp. SE-J8 TaxID=3054952 RepID=UPI00259CB5B4|nr:LacI family DNA-binding transcriptional regulator [Galbitalea sp. SE-J8]MDM4762477.1 LacI family DNA-binding transcriptional regulator [Galbitalea sp. SE-J8]
MSGITDVARAAGVSKSTASRALSGTGYVSDATRQRVVEAARVLGFVASQNAASLVTGRSRNVAVVLPYLNRWFFAEVLDGIESALIDAGYDMTLYRLRDDEAERQRVFEYFIVRKRVDAVVAVNIALTPTEVRALGALGKPIAGIGGNIDGIPTLSLDDVEASRRATEHLIGLGHRRIMHLGDDPDVPTEFPVHANRLRGFRLALADAGITIADDSRSCPYTIPGGYRVAREVLADPRTRPTAIVAGCDEIAIGAIIAARELGIPVPSGLSLVGIDDHDLAEMFELTTVRQRPAEQGRHVIDLVLRSLADPQSTVAPEALPIEMVVRRSTTAPSAAG